eukprot:gene15201-biopygen431
MNSCHGEGVRDQNRAGIEAKRVKSSFHPIPVANTLLHLGRRRADWIVRMRRGLLVESKLKVIERACCVEECLLGRTLRVKKHNPRSAKIVYLNSQWGAHVTPSQRGVVCMATATFVTGTEAHFGTVLVKALSRGRGGSIGAQSIISYKYILGTHKAHTFTDDLMGRTRLELEGSGDECIDTCFGGEAMSRCTPPPGDFAPKAYPPTYLLPPPSKSYDRAANLRRISNGAKVKSCWNRMKLDNNEQALRACDRTALSRCPIAYGEAPSSRDASAHTGISSDESLAIGPVLIVYFLKPH